MTLNTKPDRKNELHAIADSASQEFATTHADREQGLRLSREIVRNSANSIRATHRGEYEQAKELLNTVADLSGQAIALRDQQPRVYYGGYIEDALKEYTEAAVTLALIESRPMPTADELGIGPRRTLGASQIPSASCGASSSTPSAPTTSLAARSCSTSWTRYTPSSSPWTTPTR